MIDRRDIVGFTVAVLGHVGLVALILWLPKGDGKPVMPDNEPIQVTLADDISLVSADPDPSDEPPAQASQGDEALDDSTVAPPDPTSEPEKKPTPPRDNPDAAKQPTPPPKRNTQGQQGTGGRKGSLDLDPSNFTDGRAQQPTDGKGTKSEATMTGPASANIDSAIIRQVQPCADRQVIPAPEARRIFAKVQLTFNRDGSLADFTIVGHDGVDDTNRRYVARVDDAVEAVFRGCTPIRGLPAELYDIPRGWKTRKFRYQLSD